MQGINLVVHAVKILFYDIWTTVRLTVFPMVIGYGVAFSVLFLLGGDFFIAAISGTIGPSTVPTGSFFLAVFLAIVVMTIVFCWAAIGWHRFVLLEERPGALLPKFGWSHIKSYLWAAIRVFSVMFGIMILVLIVSQVLLAIGGGYSFFVIVLNLISVVCYMIFLRLSLILPSAAVGKPMSVWESLDATEHQSWTFLVIGAVVIGFGSLVPIVVQFGAVGVITQIFLSWLSFAFGISILTTIYGVFVEKREL